MTDHKDRFIFVQALGKPIVEAYMGGDLAPAELREEIRSWCHFLYKLAGELGGIEGTPRVLETKKPFSFRDFLESTFLGGIHSLAPSRFSSPLLYLWVA